MHPGYIVFQFTEDGDRYIDEVSATELEKRLTSDYYGTDPAWLSKSVLLSGGECLVGILIIPADTPVVPRAVETVTKWSLS